MMFRFEIEPDWVSQLEQPGMVSYIHLLISGFDADDCQALLAVRIIISLQFG